MMKKIEKIVRVVLLGFLCLSLTAPVLFQPISAQAASQTVGNMVIMVDFEQDAYGQDMVSEFPGLYASIRDIYTGSKASLPDYIKTVSDGQVTVDSFFPQAQGDSFVPITLPGSISTYFDPDRMDDSTFVHAVVEKLKEMSDRFPTPLTAAQLDTWNQDGYIDNVTILVQGENKGSFTSHQSNYGSDETVCFGLKVGDYNLVSTQSVSSYGYSVIAHEFMHTLGAPDLYRLSGAGVPVGVWDHMAQVPLTAQYPLVYTRSEMGWITIPTATVSGEYTIASAESSQGTRAYILKTDRSSSEYFVVEYRVKNQIGEYDHSLPVDKGLIVYRVNENVTDRTNKLGQNYIYVFRPGTASNHQDATETVAYGNNQISAVYDAAVGPGTTRDSLGSADMSAPCTQDTIFYSDGSNSGIVIDNVRFNPDGTATFDITYPTLSGDDYWLNHGETISNSSFPALAKGENDSTLYLAVLKGQTSATALSVYSSDAAGGVWTKLGDDLPAASQEPDLVYANGVLYAAYVNRDWKAEVAAWNGSQWSTLATYDAYPNRLQLLTTGSDIWLMYVEGNVIRIQNPQTGQSLVPLAVDSASIGNPAVTRFDNHWYAIYSDYFATGASRQGKVAVYDETTGDWKETYAIPSDVIDSVKTADASVTGSALYAVLSTDGSAPAILSYTEQSGWTCTSIEGILAGNSAKMQIKDNVPYVIYANGTQLKAQYLKDGIWTELAGEISNDTMNFDSICAGDTLYVASGSQTGVTVRKMKTVEGTPDPNPDPGTDPNPGTNPDPEPGTGSDLGQGQVVITTPVGYDVQGKIFVDGIECSSVAWQNDETKRLVSTNQTDAKTATMYLYNNSGVPVGMYVWKLYTDGDAYTAEAMPQLENLFSYHGFSVRYMGKTGLRCSFGMDTNLKKQLIGVTGLDGISLKEMGTMIMHPNNRKNHDMVYGSSMVSTGRTYYRENGVEYNKVIKTVNGREQFANVLVGLPQERYATDYVFKPYAVLNDNGEQLIIYGPEMSRSMYTVCKQILSRGDFQPGTSGYQFLKNIVDSVEGW